MPDHGCHAGRTRIGERLRHLRQHHPNGPISLAGLAAMSGVSKRHLQNMEAGEQNVTVETLEKITLALGINRVAYLLDEGVFDQINAELRSLKDAQALGASSIRLRSHATSAAESGPDQAEILSAMLARMVALGDEAKRMQEDLPSTQTLGG